MADEPSSLGMAFPKPGPALRATLVVLAAVSVISAIVVHWAPGPPTGPQLFGLLTFDATASAFYMQPWRLVTSGLLTSGLLSGGLLSGGFLSSGFLPSGFLSSAFLSGCLLPRRFLSCCLL